MRGVLTSFVVLLVIGTAWTATAHAQRTYVGVEPAVGKERGTVVLLHLGSWAATGKDVTETVRAPARKFARAGYRAVLQDYRRGPDGIKDVLARVDAERRRRGDHRVCIYGESAGAAWALVAAELRPWVNCVLAMVAPVDLVGQVFKEPFAELSQIIRKALGKSEDIVAASPLTRIARLKAKVLIVEGLDDEIVTAPIHGDVLRSRLRRSQQATIKVKAGKRAWMHGTADAKALPGLDRSLLRWVRKYAR